MKRRRFLLNLGLGGSGVVFSDRLIAQEGPAEVYSHGQIVTLEEAITKEGLINIRLEFKSKTPATISSHSGKINVTNGKINRIKEYFFEPGEDVLDGSTFDLSVNHENVDIVAVWIEAANTETTISIKGKKGKVRFTLGELVENQEISMEQEGLQITANFLLDQEMSEISPEDFNALDPGDDFRFVIMADPQGGDPEEEGNHPTRMKIHNAWVEESIRQTNLMKPVATLILGDIVDSQGQQQNFIRMAEFFKKLESPLLYAMGNHETRYNSVFTPGYNMEAFNNYFDAQKKTNGLELMLYSFNLGKWHFIIWPDPLRANFWETHPHYFDWLERDLEKYKDRPTLFFQHVPSHPMGINPLINYAESVNVKRTLLNILAKQENVNYIFSGHVHIPVKASFKTAVSYKGMKMINLPPAGYRPRAFGEEDFQGGPGQGILVLDIKGEQCIPTFRTVMEEEYIYPEGLPEFEHGKYRLWLSHKWELPASELLVNGNFKNGLEGWTPRYVYYEDERPSNRCESRIEDGKNTLYLYCRKRGYDIPGQDRLPQTINRITQAIQSRKNEVPLLSFQYKVSTDSDLDGWCGAYLWIEGFQGSTKLLNLIYSTGVAYAGLGGNYSKSEFTKNVHLGLDDTPGKWQEVVINIANDYENNYDTNYNSLALDRLVITLGAWTINDGSDFPYGIYFAHLKLDNSNDKSINSTVNAQVIKQKPDDKIWWMGKYFPFTHVAGDHRYILGTKKMGPKT